MCSRVWDTHTGETLHTLQHAHIVRAVAFPSTPRPTVLATGGAEKKLRVYDLTRSSSGSPSTPNALSNGTNGDAATPPASPSYEIGPGIHQGTIKSIVWGADSKTLVTAADDRKIRWWDLRSRSVVGEYEVDGVVGSCELNTLLNDTANGVLSVAAGKSVYFFDGLMSRQLMKSVKMPYEVISVALHSERRRFVTGGSSDTWVRVYDYDDTKELDVSKGHHGPIWSTSFSPDGKLYATGSEDGTIKLWKFCSDSYGLWR
ncbi:MAG: hypothetical protein M1817_000616 [Caeruleum heppii]|nr:MAG: hypothetical protein M1817_000616 [Caeruleum heppii]